MFQCGEIKGAVLGGVGLVEGHLLGGRGWEDRLGVYWEGGKLGKHIAFEM